MFQELSPMQYHCEYQDIPPGPDDLILLYSMNTAHLFSDGGTIRIPALKELPVRAEDCQYLFRIDDARFFACRAPHVLQDIEGLTELPVMALRDTEPVWTSFACITGYQLWLWYRYNRFCGCCGTVMEHSKTERALMCPQCQQTVYPRINPAVIVGVIDGDRILLTRYANARHRRYALVAGFCEIGETLEDTVRREVYEETGVRVKNFHYFNSQPWAFSSSLLMGIYCEAEDGGKAARPDGVELSVAEWKARDEIEPSDNPMSLTATMIENFRAGYVLPVV